MSSYKIIHGAIKTKLDGLKTSAKIQQVAGADLPAGEYPLVTVSPSGLENSYFESNAGTMRVYSFDVKVKHVVNKDVLDLDTVDAVVMDCVDAIINSFDQDETLSGNVDMSEPLQGEFTYEDTASGYMRVANLVIQCKIHKRYI